MWDFDAEGNYVVNNSFPNAGDAKSYGDGEFILTTPWVTSSGGYGFSGGEIYLLGYYEENVGSKRYNLNFTSETVGNPIKEAIEATLKGEDVDGKALVEKSKSTAKECFVLGFSTGVKTATSGRSFGFTGSKVYAAGDMTLFNDTTISGGIVECAGKLSSKRDLVITGGTVTAEEIGNSYNLTYTLTDKCLRWQETRISGGTVKTNRLGALSTKINGVEPRSTVVLENVAIEPLDEASEIQVVHDVYVNYIYDSTYTVPDNPKNPENVRYTATLNGEKSLSEISDMKLTDDSLNAMERLAFVAPTANDGETATWRLDNVAGKVINTALEKGTLEGENQTVLVDDNGEPIKGYDREVFRLYAAKDRYSLVVQEGLDKIKIDEILIGEETATIEGNSVKVPFGSTVQITLTDLSMADKVVAWYYDGKGILHNAMPTVEDGNIKFKMPAATTEIFITNDLSLYLNEYDILFTPYGFARDLEATNLDTASDTVFLYRGNLTVTQSNIDLIGAMADYTTGGVQGGGYLASPYYAVSKETGKSVGIYESNSARYQMIFAPGSGNANEGEDALNRDITLIDLNQYNQSMTWGLKVPENEKIVFKIDGPVQLKTVIKEAGSSLSFIGISERKELSETVCADDYLRFCEYGDSYGLRGGGDAFFENITFARHNNAAIIRLTDGGTLKYDHCYLNTRTPYTYYGETWGDLIINDCYMILGRESRSGQYSPKSFLVKDSVIKSIGSGDAATFLQAMNYLELDNSSLDISYIRGSTVYTACNTGAKNIVLKNGSKITADGRLNINALELHDTSSVVVTGEPESFLLCPNIVLYDESTVSADYILLSGYYQKMDDCGTVEQITKGLQAGTNVLNGNSKHFRTGAVPVGLVLNGGTVTAAEFVGGDVNGKITVNAGTLEAKKIGTFGATFGHARYIPKTGEEWVYRYNRIPTAAIVTVNGGTVNVTENGYLGGMNATVAINGGTVNLADGSLIGVSDADYAKLVEDAIRFNKTLTPHTITIGDDSDETKATINGTGSINVPSGTVTITGADTGMQVANLLVEDGTITIDEASGQLNNPYTGTRLHDKVGVIVTDTLKAQNVTIKDGAVVYADKAYAEAKAGEEGALEVTADGGQPAYLYTGSAYGTAGAGKVDVKVDNNNEDPENYSHVYGATMRKITYHLMDDEKDKATNPDTNLEMFIYGQGEDIVLSAPERHGYDFGGWYLNEDCSGEAVSSVSTGVNQDHDLYAKWIPKQVEFQVVIDGNVVGLSPEQMQLETDDIEGDYDKDANTFTFKRTEKVNYLDAVVDTGEGHVDLDDFRLKSYKIPALAIVDSCFNGGVAYPLTSATTEVSKEILAAYTAKGTPLVLEAQDALKDSVEITLDLNIDSVTKRPINSKFNNVSDSQSTTDTTMSSYTEYGNAVVSAKGFADASGELITASAPGYTFKGWYYLDGANKEFITKDFQITRTSATTFYAEWIPNEYQVEFNAGEGAIVTADALEPDAEDTNSSILGSITYDTVMNGGVDYEGGLKNQLLPAAWKEGNVFVGWSYDGNKEHCISADTELNLTDIPESVFDVSKGSGETALKLVAIYRPIKVTYDLDGGKWASDKSTEDRVDTPAFGAALAGYTKTAEDTYEIISTTADQYKTDGNYIENDYRESHGKKGYTFTGWQDENGNEIKTTPKYKDVSLKAQWSANTYTLQLNATTNELRDTRVYGHVDSDSNPKVTVSVEGKIEGTGVADWPSRSEEGSDWYVKNKNDDKAENRYLLGYTFDALDPGDTREGNADYDVYKEYGAYVNLLTNNGTLFVKKEGTSQKGSTFFLPESDKYDDLVKGAKEVPDYPNGSTIQMYAVYREISLVFIQYVQNDDGTFDEKVMHTESWDEYDDYPTKYLNTEDYQKIHNNNYELIGWYIHAPHAGMQEYTKGYYSVQANQDACKAYAKDLGTYDIKVYTVFAKQVTKKNVVLKAGSDPTVNVSVPDEYTILGSMQSGNLYYTISGLNGLNLVTYDDLVKENGLYNNTKANNTVAIKVELVAPNGTVEETQYLTGTTGQFTKAVGKDWKILTTLYYSSVMSTEDDYTFDLKFNFTDNTANNALKDQWILYDDMMVDLTPSIYKVTYEAVLDDDVNVTNWKDFDSNTKLYSEDVAYGSAVLGEDGLPEVEGYEPIGNWNVKDSSETLSYGGNLNVTVSAENDGEIHLSTEWKIKSYKLTAEDNVLSRWTIKDAVSGILTDAGATVPYRTEITFTPNETQEPAYIFVNGTRLDKYPDATVQDGVYKITMPAKDVHITYSKVMTLYLRYGHIDITPEGYTHKGETVKWPGDYAILMDEQQNATIPTEHLLSISGNMTERKIALDDLNISANNSINLAAGTKAELTTAYGGEPSSITAQNILVPANAELVMNGEGTLILTPDKNYAAVGGHNDACGVIELNNLTIDMTLPEGSVASGIGSGNKVNGGTAVKVVGCEVTVTEEATTSTYAGAWFGGVNVETVIIQDTAVYRGEESKEMIGTQVTNGKTVTITGTTIGTADNPVTAPINAQDTLRIQSDSLTHNVSEIYQDLNSPNAVAIGTEPTGKVFVQGGSKILAEVFQPKISDAGHKVLYTGKMNIMDASSDVVIANTQLVDMANSDITITADGVTQNGVTLAHDGNYRIINEQDGKSNESVDLTVNGLANNARIETTKINLEKVTINADTKMELLGDLDIVGTGHLWIADGKTLSVEENSNTQEYTITVGSIEDNNGTYEQIGGELDTSLGNRGIQLDKMDIVLDGVTTNVKNLIAENLTLHDSTVNSAGGKVGSNCANGGVTNVVISGITTVTAATIGALGEQDKTFTFVPIDGTATVTGTVVRDLYRLNYNLNGDTNFNTTNLHTVLRETIETDKTTTLEPTIPDDPTFNNGAGASYFKEWYILQENDDRYALSETEVAGYAGYTVLSNDKIQYADPVAEDGTRTLQIYAAFDIHGTAVIDKGRWLNDNTVATETTVKVLSDGAWTAIFETSGGLIANSQYQVSFDTELPVGTKLTLVDRSGTHPVYYAYITTNATANVIPFDSFKRMGGTEEADLLADNGATTFEHRILLAADFADSNAPVSNVPNKITLQLKVGESTPMNLATVSYTVAEKPVATLTAESDSVVVSWTGDERLDGQKVYLVGELTTLTSVPYCATALVDGTPVDFVSGNRVIYEIGDAKTAINAREVAYAFSGLAAGDYGITWKLTASKDTFNVLGNLLASDAATFSVDGTSDPSMSVEITSIDRKPEESRVLTQGTTHTVAFRVNTNRSPVVVSVEKQGGLGDFTEQEAQTVTTTVTEPTLNGNIMTAEAAANFSEGAAAGTYRVRFSINENTDADDVYITFIVE